MRAKEFVVESIAGFVKQKLGLSWTKAGDIVRGSVVADYLESNSYYVSDNVLDYIRQHKYKITDITPTEAEQFRNTTGDVLDVDRQDKMSMQQLTYQSLMKLPPIVNKKGRIIDGNHRLDRAIKQHLVKIPVLREI